MKKLFLVLLVSSSFLAYNRVGDLPIPEGDDCKSTFCKQNPDVCTDCLQ